MQLNNARPNLSIIIPTKNRQATAIYAIESVLRLQKNNIEIIVNDCSDTNILESMLYDSGSLMRNVRYYYTNQSLSMVENWNSAISRASGQYLCAIGDDDAVLPGIVEVVDWMISRDADAALFPLITYIWKDAYVGSFSNSKLTFPKHLDGLIWEIDMQREFARKAISCGFGYTEGLPNIYHGVIKKEILDRQKIIQGVYLRGSSLDVYAAFSLTSFTKRLLFVNFPVSIRGVCGQSNANRILTADSKKHFDEIKNYSIPDFLPQMLNCEVSTAESCFIALRDTGNSLLTYKMNLAVVYGKLASIFPLLFLELFHLYKQHKRPGYKDISFFVMFARFLLLELKVSSFNLISGFTCRLFPGFSSIISTTLFPSRVKVVARDIREASDFVVAYLYENKVQLNIDRPIRLMPPSSSFWD